MSVEDEPPMDTSSLFQAVLSGKPSAGRETPKKPVSDTSAGIDNDNRSRTLSKADPTCTSSNPDISGIDSVDNDGVSRSSHRRGMKRPVDVGGATHDGELEADAGSKPTRTLRTRRARGKAAKP